MGQPHNTFIISALYYAYKMLEVIESRHDYDLITTTERPTHIHQSKRYNNNNNNNNHNNNNNNKIFF